LVAAAKEAGLQYVSDERLGDPEPDEKLMFNFTQL
jgi:hypothetical protein